MKRLFLYVGGAALIGGLFFWAYHYDPSTRFKREHGFSLPVGHSKLFTCGDAWWQIMDRGRVAFFSLEKTKSKDFLEGLRSQFRVTSNSNCDVGDPGSATDVFPSLNGYPFPGNDKYVAFSGHWGHSVKPLFGYGGRSPTGSYLRVEVWELNSSEDLIKVYTDWN